MNFKKILALVLVVAMCLSMVPTYAFADDVELWDEGDAAVQNDAPLEDEYIDEDPVTQEPAEEEPEATDPAEPAAEESAPAEPAAEESAPAEASADTSNALTAEELNAYAALGDKAMIGSKTYATFAAAVDAAVAGDTITMLASDELTAPVTLDKDLTIQSGTTKAKLTGTILITGGNVTLTNVDTTSVTVTGGKLSIPENDLGTNTSIIASAGVTGDVKGGKFDEISGSLLADGYAPVNYAGTTPLSGTVQAKDGLAKYTWVATRVDANGTYYYTNDKFANAFGELVDPENNVPGTVTLLGNVTLKNAVAVQTEVTLDLNGHTITNGTAFTEASLLYTAGVSGHGTGKLTIKDSDTAGTGAITATGTTVKQAVNLGLGALTIQSGKISGPNAIYMNAGTLSITGGTLTATADTGAAIYLNNNNGDLTATITISNGTFSGPRAVIEEGSKAGDSITVTGGIFKTTDTTADKNTVVLKTVDTTNDGIKPSFSGGTYDTRVSDKYLKQGSVCVKNTEGTWTIQPGSYVAYILNKDKSVSVGYEQSNFTDAVAAAITGYKKTANDSLYLFVESGEQTATLEAGNSMRVQIKDTDVSFIPYLADPVNTYFVFLNEPGKPLADYTGKPILKTENPIQIIVENYIAKVGTQYYENTDAKWSEAIADAKELKAVFEPLKTGGSVALGADEVIMIKETDKITVTVNKDLGVDANYQIVKIAGEEYNTYKCIVPVASYVDAEGNTVYTETFAEAATEAAKLAQRGNFRVNLYQKPAFNDTVKDVYALGENSTLTVIATGTDIQVADLEAKDPIYKSEYYKLMVTNDGEVAVEADHTEANADFIYTAKTPVAKARLNTEVETYEYFADVNEAVKFVVEDHPNDHLYLIPLDNKTFTVAENQIEKYLGKTIRIDNSGEKKIKLADVQYPTENPKNFYTYTATDAEGYTNYVLNPAVVKIPAKPEMNIYYDVVPGTNTKFFASFAEAVEADSTAVIELIATPTDLTTHKPTTEPYELGIPGGPSTLKVRLNKFDWLKVNPYGQAAVVEKPDTTDTTVTVYSLAEPVASITTGTGASAKTEYYDDFADAAYDAYTNSLETCATITLLKTIEEPYALTTNWCFKVIKGDYNVTVTAKDPDMAVLAVTDDNGVTSYSVVAPVASIYYGEEVGTKNYATFAEAAKLAYVAEGVEPTLTVTLLQDPAATDKYEVAAAGSFLVDIGNFQAKIVDNNLSFAEGTALIADTPTPVSGGIKTYNVTIVNAVASVEKNGEPKLYATLKDAVDDFNYSKIVEDAPTTINMLASDETEMGLTVGYQINVKLNGFTVNVVPVTDGATDGPFAITKKLDEATGVTNYQCTTAVASIDFGGEEDVKYYATFAEAAKLAFVPADAEGQLVITLYQKPVTTDKFEVSAPGMFTVDIGSTGAIIVRDNLSFAEGTTLVATPAPVEGTASTYTVTIVGAVAYVDNNGVPTYFDSFQHAVDAGNYAPNNSEVAPATIYMLASDETAMKLTEGYQVNVKLNGFTVGVVPFNEGPYMILDETDETTEVTNYQCITAVASIGADEDIKYYATFTEAATDSAKDVEDVKNPKTITLYQDSEYVLGKEGNVSVLKVTAKNNADLTVTSGVAKQAVSKSKEEDVTTYTLNADAAAYIYDTKDKSEVYYDSLEGTDGAQKAAEYSVLSTSTKQLVLLKEVKTYIVGNGMQVNIKQGGIVPGEVKVAEGYIKVETPSEDGTVINYKSEQAVASVASITPAAGEKPTYYATFAEAAKEAFVAEGTEPTKVVTLIQELAAEDQFEVESVGSVVIDVNGKETIADIQKNNFKLADGLFSANDKPATGKPYTVTITSAVAKVIKNNGEPKFYNSIAAAAKDSKDAKHPIVLLANDLSYALAAGATIYVVKGENEFTVTKVKPAESTPKVAILVEELADGVTKYTATTEASTDIVAHIDFEKTVDKGDFDTQTVHEYVYYTNFADAVEDANNGEFVIVLERKMTKTATLDETYTIKSADEVVRVLETNTFTALIAPADGFALNKEAEKDAAGTATGVNKYTVFNSVAKVNAKHDGGTRATDKNYPDLKSAIDDALKLNGTLTLLATPPLGFTYELVNNEYREDELKLGASSQYKFSRNHFTVAEGQYVDGKFDGTAETLTVKTAKFSVGEGDDLKYYETFEAAVVAAQDLEDQKGNNDKTKDKANPTAVISLYIDMDETAPYAIGNTVNSLLVKDNGHKVSFSVPAALKTGYFVEKTGSSMEGVNKYSLATLVASITTGTGDNEKTVDYSTFKAAAEDAFNTENVIKLHKKGTELAATDIYEMPVGELRLVYDGPDAETYSSSELKNTVIKAKGERVFLDDEYVNGYRRFTVTGAVASITKQSGTTFYYDIADAIKAALNGDYFAITPLTDINVRLDNADLTKIGAANGAYFNVEDSEYNFSVKTDAEKVDNTAPVNYELVKVGNTYTFKTAVAYVVSEDKKSVDPDTNKPTYYYEYFATIASASDYASNANAAAPKTIVLLKNDMAYVLQSENEVVVAQFGDAVYGTGPVEKFTVSANVEGSTVSDKLTGEAVSGVHRGIHTYKLAKLETITLIAGEGAWGTGTTAEHQKSAQTYAGGDLLKLPNSIGTVYQPEREGYTLVNWTGNDGNTYVWKFSGLTEDEIAAGYKVLPSEMPEGGLELKANWKANEYWVVLRSEHSASAPFVAFKGTYGEKLTLPEDLSAIKQSGYDFDSWYKYDDTSFTTPWNFSNDLFVNPDTGAKLIDDTTKTAGGTAIAPTGSMFNMLAKLMPAVQTITWNFEGGTPDPDSKYPEKYLITDEAITIFAPKREGYKFGGWNLQIDGENKGTVAGSDPFTYTLGKGYSGNRVFTAIWEPIEMNIQWVNDTVVLKETTANVGDRIDPLTRYGDTPTAVENTKNVVDLTKDGYRLDPNNLWTDYDGVVPYDESLTWVYHLNWIEQVPVSFFVDDEVTTINVDKNSSLAESKDVPAPTKEGYTLVWTLKGEEYDMTAAVSEKMTLVGVWVEGEDYSDYATISPSLSLEENINMNAYVTIKEGTDPADYGVTVTFNGETTVEGTLADLATYYRGEYKLSDIAIVAAPQMNDPAVVTITYKGVEVISNAELTVRAYAEDWIERSTTDTDLRELLIALLDFGAYSQLQFGYDTTNLANSKYSSGIVPSTVVPTFEVRTEGSVSGITGSKIALTLVSDTTMNMYFAAAKKGSYQFKIDGEEAKTTYSNKEYKVALPTIAVAELGDTHDFTVTGGNATMTVTAAPLAYAFQHQNDSGDLGNVCKAVYLYYQAAVAYFG